MANSRRSSIVAMTLIIFIALASCNLPRATSTPDLSLIVAQTQTAIAINQVLTSTAAAKLIPTATLPVPIQPSITPQPQDAPDKNCVDKAKFVNESVSDNTSFLPGDTFIKTWTLLNDGTCPWTPDYALVFVEGNQMGGASPAPIGKMVEPGTQIQLSISQSAPQEEGEYQGFWKLQSPNGAPFGLGTEADVSFWVKINVSKTENSVENELGPPAWTESFENNSSVFPLGAGSETSYEVKDGDLVMTAFMASGDLWRVAPAYLGDFYIETRFKTGPSCSGKDSYGLILRAPEQADNIIDSGYIFGLSCDGNFRAYLMNNGAYNNLVSWTGSSAIQAGSGKSNTLGIKASGATFQIYANGTLVFEFEDATYFGGLFGLMIRSDGTVNFQVLVQEISYWLNP